MAIAAKPDDGLISYRFCLRKNREDMLISESLYIIYEDVAYCATFGRIGSEKRRKLRYEEVYFTYTFNNAKKKMRNNRKSLSKKYIYNPNDIIPCHYPRTVQRMA